MIGAYALILLALININGTGVVFVIITIFMVMLVLTLLWASICYKEKDMKLVDLFNVKSVLNIWLSSLMVLAISCIIFFIAYFISDVIGLIIAVPLLIINNIIIENIVINYASSFKQEQTKVEQATSTQKEVSNQNE